MADPVRAAAAAQAPDDAVERVSAAAEGAPVPRHPGQALAEREDPGSHESGEDSAAAAGAPSRDLKVMGRDTLGVALSFLSVKDLGSFNAVSPVRTSLGADVNQFWEVRYKRHFPDYAKKTAAEQARLGLRAPDYYKRYQQAADRDYPHYFQEERRVFELAKDGLLDQHIDTLFPALKGAKPDGGWKFKIPVESPETCVQWAALFRVLSKNPQIGGVVGATLISSLRSINNAVFSILGKAIT